MAETISDVAESVVPTHSVFISYAREDAQIAAAIQAGLIEITRANSMAAPNQRLRVFRDVTNLVPGQPLSDALRQNILCSQKLILIASTHAVRSRWVRIELAAFLEGRSPADLIIVLVGGELCWSEADRTFALSEQNAFPDLGHSIFTAEPLFLDLRAAALSKRSLSLRDPAFMDCMATLLVSIVGGRKDDVVGQYVEHYRRDRKHLIFNLGFRGCIGFAFCALLATLANFLIGLPLQNALDGPLWMTLAFAASVPVSGLGALVCRLGLRGYLASVASLTLVGPFAAIGTLQTFDDSLWDKLGLAVVSLAGFGCAGLIFSTVLRRFNTSRVIAIFAVSSVLSSLPFLLIKNIRTGETTFQIFAFPWLFERWRLVIPSLAGAFYSFPILAAIIGSTALIGLLLGMEQARTEIPALIKAPEKRAIRLARRVWKRTVITAAIVVGLIAFYVRSPWNEIPLVVADLNPRDVEANLGDSPFFPEDLDKYLHFGYQARDAFRRAGDLKASNEFAGLIRKWIRNYLDKLEDRNVVAPGLSATFRAHAKEVTPILRKSVDDARQSPVQLALLSRVARQMGATELADAALNQSVSSVSPSTDSQTLQQVAVALADAARIDQATTMLTNANIAMRLNDFWCSEDFARVLWTTGIWTRISETSRDKWDCNPVVGEAMMATRQWEAALSTLQKSAALPASDPRNVSSAAIIAANLGRFDIAEQVAGLLRREQTWRTYAETQLAIGERAFAQHNNDALLRARANLSNLLDEASSTPYFNDIIDLKVSYWKLEFHFGDRQKASRILDSMSVSYESAEALTDQARSDERQSRRTLAKQALGTAWSYLHRAEGRIDPQCETLGDIAEQLVSMHELANARTIAEECRPWRFENYWFARYAALAKVLDAYTR